MIGKNNLTKLEYIEKKSFVSDQKDPLHNKT